MINPNIESMSNEELVKKHNYFTDIVRDLKNFCVEYDYFGKFGRNDYARLTNENYLLNLRIEMMKRNLI